MLWLCGGCGDVHGWVCPYYGAPSSKHTKAEIKEIKRKIKEDKNKEDE